MENKELTQEQIKELWEWCGFKFTPHLSSKGNAYEGTELIEYPDRFKHVVAKGESLEPDLNNLFKYAVPMPPSYNPDIRLIQSITFDYGRCSIIDVMGEEYVGESQDPALALYWALWAVMKEAK